MSRCCVVLGSSRCSVAAVVLAVGLVAPNARASAETRMDLSSPDGRVRIAISAGTKLTYAITFASELVILPSPVEIALEGGGVFGSGVRVALQSRRAVDVSWTAVHGKRRQVRDRANELRLELVETASPRRRLELIVRASDDGAAFRYGIPMQPGLETFTLRAERTQVRFAGDYTAWAANYRSFTTSQETEFRPTSIDQLSPRAIVGLPLLVRAGDRAWVGITEADLVDWAGMYLRGGTATESATTTLSKAPVVTTAHTLETTLSPRPDRPSVVVIGTERRWSPWRVFLLGDRPGALIESDLVRNLATPSQIADPSWIKPGRAAWDRWWSGDFDPDAKFKLGMNTATMKSFVEAAAALGWEYQIVDWTWYGDPARANADLTKPTAALDLPGLVAFAAERKVGLWLWARFNHLDRQMDAALPLYERWGIKGVKVDFMDRDDQVMVNFYWRLAKAAAEHHLLVDMHGAFKPTGLERTWPNMLTREGVMGNEYNKWSSRVTPTHKVTLPFTRMLAGPMDFTPGGFRHSPLSSFTAKDHAPTVMGTRAAELALTVVYESALLVLCDSPYEYRHARGQGAEFLQRVPTAWDETRVLEGMPGAFITIARRAGDTWYLAGLTSEAERTTRVPLSLLGLQPGTHRLQLWADARDSDAHPEKVVQSERAVTGADVLDVGLGPGGGFVAILGPALGPALGPVGEPVTRPRD